MIPGGFSHTKAIQGRVALQGMVFLLFPHKLGLKFKDFRNFYKQGLKITHFNEKK